jgi:hypothetical protein
MNYSSGLFSSHLKTNEMNSNSNNTVYQDILSSDAKFNLHRIHNSSQLSIKNNFDKKKEFNFIVALQRNIVYETSYTANERERF